MTLGDERFAASVQGYCVDGQCEDVAPALGDVHEVDAGPVEAEFDWEWGSADASFSLCRGLDITADCDRLATREGALEDGFEFDLTPGAYRLSVFLAWEGGDATYHYPLEAPTN